MGFRQRNKIFFFQISHQTFFFLILLMQMQRINYWMVMLKISPDRLNPGINFHKQKIKQNPEFKKAKQEKMINKEDNLLEQETNVFILFQKNFKTEIQCRSILPFAIQLKKSQNQTSQSPSRSQKISNSAYAKKKKLFISQGYESLKISRGKVDIQNYNFLRIRKMSKVACHRLLTYLNYELIFAFKVTLEQIKMGESFELKEVEYSFRIVTVDQENSKIRQQQELRKIVKEIGNNKWEKISRRLKQRFPEIQRNGKQCRQRYMNYLEPNDRNEETHEWELSSFGQLFQLYLQHGTKWSQIAKQMIHWSQNFIKNKFNGIMRKVLRKICNLTEERSKKNNRLKFKTLISLMNFPQGPTEHSAELIRKTHDVKQQILRQALEIQKGNDNVQILHDIAKGINEFTTKNKGYLMSLGKKKAHLKMNQISDRSQDQGFQSVVVLRRRKDVCGFEVERLDAQATKNSKKQGDGCKGPEKLNEKPRATAIIIAWPAVKKQEEWI